MIIYHSCISVLFHFILCYFNYYITEKIGLVKEHLISCSIFQTQLFYIVEKVKVFPF